MTTKVAYTIAEVCAMASIGRTTVYQSIKEGQLRAIKLGRRTLILAEDLRKWLGEMPSAA
jgi:excisionase family DNA binding protein